MASKETKKPAPAKVPVTAPTAEAAEAAEAGLRKEWGKNYEANMAHASEAAKTFPDLSQLELKDGTLVGSSPHFAKLLSTIGRQNSEGGMQAGFMASEAGVDLKSEHARLTEEINTAHNLGDSAKAQRLDDDRQKISSKLYGNRPIAGQQM